MDVFILVLKQMLMMFILMVAGFLLRRKNILPEKADITLSKLETYLFVPALNLYNQLTKCTVDSFLKNYKLMFYGLVMVIVAIGLSYPISKLFVRNPEKRSDVEYQRSIYKYAIAFGNYGFIGNFIVLGIWGADVFYQYSMFTFFVGIFCSAWGIYTLVPKEQGMSLAHNLRQGLLKPPVIALLLGMAGGLLGITRFVPDFVMDALSNASNCMGPVSMILAGIVIGGYNLKGLFINKKVYIVSFLRLIVIPSVFVLILKAIGTSDEIVSLALIAFATPLGMNTIVYPAAFGGDTKTGASMTMVSSLLSIITIPVMYLVFVVLL